MEKLKSSIDVVSKNFFSRSVFAERLIGRSSGVTGTTALLNNDTGLFVVASDTGGYNVYLKGDRGFDVYAESLDDKTVSVCAVLSYIEISVERYLYEKFGSFDYLDSLDREMKDERTLSETEAALNDVFSKIGIKKELFFRRVGDDGFCCFGVDFKKNKVNSFISKGEELYVWEMSDRKLGQITSSDFTKFDNGIFQSICIALEKTMFLMLEKPFINNDRKNVYDIGL